MAAFNPDPFDSGKTQPTRIGRGDAVWNVLTMGAGLMTLAMMGWFGWVFMNPHTLVNPFPPPTVPVSQAFVALTPTEEPAPPTETPTLVPPTPTLTATALPATAEKLLNVLPTATETSEARPNYSFGLKSDPVAIDASILYPDRDCTWVGVGGQVLDLQGRPVTGISVQFGGSLDGKVVDLMGLTGTVLKYGEAGFEFTITDSQGPLASTHNFWIRLVDQQKLPLSDKVYFDTYGNCGRNLTVINFKQVR